MEQSQKANIEVVIKQEPEDCIDTEQPSLDTEALGHVKINSDDIELQEPIQTHVYFNGKIKVGPETVSIKVEPIEGELINENLDSDLIENDESDVCDMCGFHLTNADHVCKPYQCEVCDERFTKKSLLSKHFSKLHPNKKRFECGICDKSFNRSGNFKIHMRIHTGERPFKCEICYKSFKVNCALTVHMRIHSGEEPHSCEICNKKFNALTQMKIHMRSHTGERPFSCEMCDKMFKSSSELKVHMIHHTDDKPYPCEMCPKIFKLKRSLEIHMRNHTGLKPFFCNICNRSFEVKQKLNTHMRNHTDEQKYYCEICDKNFRTISNLTKHNKEIHSGDLHEPTIKNETLSEPESLLQFHLKMNKITNENPMNLTE